MRWREIVSEKLTQALPLYARTDSGIKKAAPLIPAAQPVDPLASVVQQVAPMVGAAAQQSAQQAVAMDDQEEDVLVAKLLAQQADQAKESMMDKEQARDQVKKKFIEK